MSTSRQQAITITILPLLLAGCAVSHGTFITSTHIGIKADVKTEQVSIGVGRTDLFVGPGYPDKGTVPSIFGSIRSNLQVFSPEVTQLYATGAAADEVTQASAPRPPATQTDPDLSGTRRALVFGTNTDVGLKLGFVSNVPSSINLGYDREEFSIIPLKKTLDTNGPKDVYAPVIASVSLNVNSSTPQNSGLALNQFFATGNAAMNLAASSSVRGQFQDTAEQQVDQAALQTAVGVVTQQTLKVKTYLDSGSGYAANCATLKASPQFNAGAWGTDPCSLSEADFMATLSKNPDLAKYASDATPTTP